MRSEVFGRDRELAVLAGCLDAALDAQPRVVLCRGEPGIGKTRLAEEVARAAAARGVAGVWGHAVDGTGAPPYWPWRQVLRAVADLVDLPAVAREHRLTDDLARLAPDVFAQPAHPGDGSTEARFRQFDAVGRLLRQVALHRPLLIVLDDAHWADPPSLLLLQHVTRTMRSERLLVLVNHRDTEQLHGVLTTELPREPVTRQVELHGLALREVGRHLAQVVGHDVGDSEVERVHARSGGNPFFVGELGRALAVAGTAATPVTVREAIGARLAGSRPPACGCCRRPRSSGATSRWMWWRRWWTRRYSAASARSTTPSAPGWWSPRRHRASTASGTPWSAMRSRPAWARPSGSGCTGWPRTPSRSSARGGSMRTFRIWPGTGPSPRRG